MNLLLIFAFLFLGACASRPATRTEAQTNYLEAEESVQERSRARADHAGRAAALALQIRAIDSQIDNQRLVISRWRAMPEVPSGPAMIKNAQLRLRQLNAEKEELLRRQREELDEVKDLEEEP